MEQRIVFNVPMSEEESRKKAMKIASKMKGVMKVEVEKDLNHLVVVGKGIDSVELGKCLRKKFCFANIDSVSGATASQRPPGSDNPNRNFEPARHYDPPVNYYVGCPTIYDPNPPTPCSIM